MNEIQTKYLLEELSKQKVFENALVANNVGGIWVDCRIEKSISDSVLISRITPKHGAGKFKKFLNPTQVVLWAQKENLAVALCLPKKTRETTIEATHNLLLTCIALATKSYFANHDPLTRVLNRHGIQWELERAIPRQLRTTAEIETVDQQLPVDDEISLLSFDIDRFKTVNDTYGHDVGDAVLVMFASRINGLLRSIEQELAVKCIFGRPGGEEFELVVKGKLGATSVSQLANKILQCIRQPALPSEEDKKKALKSHPELSALKEFQPFPAKVTASIGIAVQQLDNSLDSSTEKIYARLRGNSDAALYRAKNDGRDCFRVYDEIRMHHGRVYEYHTNSDLVIIDIGNDVGVEKGDVYRVFYPPFLGDKIFFEDGRSSKVLGIYPNIESATLTVVEVQKQVSTCVVINKETSEPIPKGALLEYVHSGSKPLLIKRPKHGAICLGNADSIVDYISQLIRERTSYSVLKLKGFWRQEDERSKNIKYNELLSAIHLVFSSNVRVFGSNGSGLYLVLSDNTEDSSETKKYKIVSALEELTSFAGKIYAGVCFPETIDQPNNICSESVIFYCNAALQTATGDKTDSKFVFFDSDTPENTLYSWRKKRMIQDALADHQHFSNYGLRTPALDNQMGLAILDSNSELYFPLAELAFRKAYEADPSRYYFKANLALIMARLGKFDDAYKLLSEIKDFVMEKRSLAYLVAYTKSFLERKKSGEIIDNSSLIALLKITETRIKETSLDQCYSSWLTDISKAIAELD